MFTGGGYDEGIDIWAAGITLYKLLTEKQDWLKNTVVIIDPCINFRTILCLFDRQNHRKMAY